MESEKVLASDTLKVIIVDNKKDEENITENTNNDKSIAVLAFADMSPNKDQEYFSDGISEEILNLLTKIPDLKVMSRTSSFSYKGKEQNIKKIGEELQVAYVLEGSIRKSGNTFRITAQLINVADGAHLWSKTYDRNMKDIFKIQDEISAIVIQQLKVTLSGESIKSKTVDIEAYNLFLQAKQLRKHRTAESNKNAEVLIRQSIAIDSTYAPTWSALSSLIFSMTYTYSLIPMEEGLSKGMGAAQRAIALDSTYAVAYSNLASFQRLSWDFESANASTKKALALEPDNAAVIGRAAVGNTYIGKIDEAIALKFKTLALDPLNYSNHYNLAFYYAINKQYEQAEVYIQTYLLHYPNAAWARYLYARILLGKGETAQALAEVEKEPHAFFKPYYKSVIVYAMGNTTEADTLLAQLVKDWGHIAWPNIASVFAYRDEKDQAFKWLELAYDNKDGTLFENLNLPEFENLWSDPRWNAFINKQGLPKDHGFHLD